MESHRLMKHLDRCIFLAIHLSRRHFLLLMSLTIVVCIKPPPLPRIQQLSRIPLKFFLRDLLKLHHITILSIKLIRMEIYLSPKPVKLSPLILILLTHICQYCLNLHLKFFICHFFQLLMHDSQMFIQTGKNMRTPVIWALNEEADAENITAPDILG